MMNVLIRADADSTIGAGHLMRCIALSAALRERGAAVTVLSRCENGRLADRVVAGGCALVTLDATHPQPADLACTLKLLGTQHFDILVLDGYHFDESYVEAVHTTGCRVMMIDDGVRLAHYAADVLLDQNVHAADVRYPASPGTQLLLGPRYALLRPEFLAARPRRVPASPQVDRMLVTLGGADPDNVTAAVVDALVWHDNRLSIDVVIGPANPHVVDLRRRFGDHNARISLHEAPPDMAQLIAVADLAISAAGSTALELAALGVPALLVITAANQAPVADALERSGAAWNLGWCQSIEPGMLREAVSRLSGDVAARSKMTTAGTALVDRTGAARVAAVLAGSAAAALRLREATGTDAEPLWRLANEPAVRQQSFSPEPIAFDAHLTWYSQRLSSADTRIWVIEDATAVLGQIRYERVAPQVAELDYAVRSDHRGRGIGTRLLVESWELACRALELRVVRGVVLAENVASARAFQKAGFCEVEPENRSGRRCRVFVRRVTVACESISGLAG